MAVKIIKDSVCVANVWLPQWYATCNRSLITANCLLTFGPSALLKCIRICCGALRSLETCFSAYVTVGMQILYWGSPDGNWNSWAGVQSNVCHVVLVTAQTHYQNIKESTSSYSLGINFSCIFFKYYFL